MKFIALLFVSASLLAACSSSENESASQVNETVETADVMADTAYTNGSVYTVNSDQPWAEAVAIKDGEFLVVGSNTEVGTVIGSDTEVVDLDGSFVMPGLQDTHVHFEAAYRSPMLEGVMLTYTPEQNTIEKLQAALVKYAEANPDLPVLFAEQLPMEIFPNQSPTRAFIDAVVPDRPVVMLTNTEHEAVLNTAALKMEGITAETTAPPAGELIKDSTTGEPTGFMKESAAGKWAWKYYPEPSREKQAQGALAIVQYLNSVGITSAKQLHAKGPVAVAFRDLEEDGKLTMRIALAWTYRGPLEPMPLEEQDRLIANRADFDTPLINPDFVKMTIDGNFGSTGFALEPYAISGGHGIQAISQEDLNQELARFDAIGVGVTVHAMGDAAARQMLDAMEFANKNGELKARHQLGHASSIHPDDLPRLVAYDLTPEFSPVLWDPNEMIDGIASNAGDERMSRLFPMRSVHEAGGRVVIGSDGPLFWHEPLETLEVSITRQVAGGGDRSQTPEEGIDLDTAIRAMTLNSAYLMDQDDLTGSIETGKRADMIVLDKNLFKIPVTDISKAKVQLTVFDGNVVYDVTQDPTGEEAIGDVHGIELDLEGDAGYRSCKH